MGLGVPEIILILIALAIPVTIIFVIFLYFRKSQKLKQEQIELLRKIADK
jgi:preprotein translocase subunit YajC